MKKLLNIVSLVLMLSMVLTTVVVADNLIPDGDYATPIAPNALELGDICAGESMSGNVLFAINRVGGGQTFADSATVTVSVDQEPANATATMTDSTIVLPSNWVSLNNNTLSTDTAASEVTVDTTGLALDSYSQTVKYQASGAKDGSGTVTRPGNLVVTWKVIECGGSTNKPPTVDAGGSYSGNEGSDIALDSGSASDSDGTIVSTVWSIDSESVGTGSCSLSNANSLVNATITCTDNGTAVVKLTATDDDDAFSFDTADVTINNVAPTVTLSGPTSADENDTKSYSFTTSDPGTADTFTLSSVSCGLSGAVKNQSFTEFTGAGSFDCFFADDNPTGTASDTSTVAVTVADDDLGSDDDSIAVTVSNVAPTVTITSPADGSVFAVNTPIDFVVTFTDPGTLDTFTCELSSEAGTYDPACTSPYTFEDVTFDEAGIYTVTVKVTDDDTGEDSASIMVIVYDPSAGFVTGGGWIYSPAGAYTADETLEGKAIFGFVSKYLKGAKVPTGNTQFQFHAAGFNFKSTSYEWLVVSGPQAQYKGVGTVNGMEGYGFMLTARDEALDTFRLKIWELGTDQIVYDNGINQVLGSGSIIIHTGKK